MSDDLVEKYGGPVPRYTSYPTAPHFHDGVNAETYGAWLKQIPAGTAVSLYIHVPFCAEMCWYCGCHTKIVARYDPIATYARHLGREIELLANAAGEGLNISHIHWGGGTPTALSEADFTGLMEGISKHFHITTDAEVAVEIDPRTLSQDMVTAMAKAGVNRASLGVQDFEPRVQKAINRVQSFEATEATVTWLRDAGIDNISFDLMYGLPEQSVDSVVHTVDLAHRLAPDRLSVFGYAHVPWMKTHQRLMPEDALPDSNQRLAQSEAITERLLQHGYDAIGLDHFARPDDAMNQAAENHSLRRNFQGYTTDTADVLLGIGASAIGNLPGGYVQNEPALGRYATMIESGELAVTRGKEVSTEDAMRRHIIEQLMCSFQVDLSAAAGEFGLSGISFGPEKMRLQELADDGLVSLDGSMVQVSEAGQPFVRVIAAAFDQYLDQGPGRHSKAV